MFEHLQREKADKKSCFQPPVLFGGDLQRFLEKVINHGKLLLLVSGDEEKKINYFFISLVVCSKGPFWKCALYDVTKGTEVMNSATSNHRLNPSQNLETFPNMWTVQQSVQ